MVRESFSNLNGNGSKMMRENSVIRRRRMMRENFLNAEELMGEVRAMYSWKKKEEKKCKVKRDIRF